MKNFEELEVWKAARSIRLEIQIIVKQFPSEEKYRLIDQIVRSSRSIGDNIAEGHGRYHFQENIQFCRIARGSLTETLNHVICATDEHYISSEQLSLFRIKYDYSLKLINGYILYLQKRKQESLTTQST